MDLILGDRNIRKALEQDESINKIEEWWQDDLKGFDKLRQEVFLYN
jgi:uncharacterized protein YbbC (DUF1343 family)